MYSIDISVSIVLFTYLYIDLLWQTANVYIYIYVYSPLISHDRYQNHFYRMGCLCVYVLNISDGGASEFVPLHCIIRIIC